MVTFIATYTVSLAFCVGFARNEELLILRESLASQMENFNYEFQGINDGV